MNNNSLEQTFTNTANAIRAKLHTQDGITPENFATEIAKISGGSGDTGIYHVNTLAERDSLSAKENDICLVHSIQETEISENSVFNTFTFKDSFVVDEAFQDSVHARFRSEDESIMCDFSIEYYDNNFDIMVFAEIDGEFKDASIRYTSQDGLTFNLEMARGDLIDGNIVNLPVKVSYEDEGRPIDQNIFKFGTIKELYFPGIYKYDGTNWNYLDIGITTPQDNLFTNKKAYTSSGVIQGTFDRSRYKNTNIYYGTGAPDIIPTSKGALYLQVKQNARVDAGRNNGIINFISKKDTNYNKVEEETLPYSMYNITHYKNKVYGFYKNTNTDRYIYEFNLDTKQFRQIYHFTHEDYGYSKIIVTDENTAFLFMYNRNIYKLDLTTLNTSELGMPEEYNKNDNDSALIHYKKENQLIRLTKSSDWKYYNIHRYDLTNNVWLSNIKVQYSGYLENVYSILTRCKTVYGYIGDNKILVSVNSIYVINLDDYSYTKLSAFTGGSPVAYDEENNIIYSYYVNGFQGFYICKDTLSDGTYSNYSISVDLISYPLKGQVYLSYQVFYNNKVYIFTSYNSTSYLTTFSNIKGQLNKHGAYGLTIYLGETIDEMFNILEDKYYIDNLLIYDTPSTEGNNNYNAILKYYKYVDNNWVLVKDYTQQNNS